jgi:hypothetical protein
MKVFYWRESPKTILKLDPNTPKFHGNVNDDVDDQLLNIKINLDIAQIPAVTYIDYLTNYCVGKAGTCEGYVSRKKISSLR